MLRRSRCRGQLDRAAWHNIAMRIKLIEDLPMATSAELYQLSWVIDQLLADPRRIVQARTQLHTGQPVQFFDWNTGKLKPARVIAMKDRRVTLLDEASRSHFTAPYEAIMLTPSGESMAATSATPASTAQTKPSPPPEIARREDFRIGNRVSFTDRDLQQRVGLIVRINQRTATLDCDGQTWRVAFGLLRHLVDI